eukprot:TRINITY_DN2578_c0_g1_i6.p1 TRINITY_DN2578_c0_g1~~TRINITY_DN2578_c0_g1_i6.p1  ORF type:complete len:292 (-),score=85.18 TRINITY_DN2578_c0_g1_i6:276-1151(-)
MWKLLVLGCVCSLAQAGNIAEELTNQGATELLNLVTAAGLAETLTNPDAKFTVFAPTNEAIGKLPSSLVSQLTSDTELLKKVLLFHVVEGEVKAGDIQNDASVNSVEGSPLRTNIYLRSRFYDGFVTINGKRVSKADIMADNGVIHMVTDVIYPFPSGNIAEIVSSDPRFSTLLAAVGAAGLADTLSGEGPFTVFAPTNDAFEKIPKETLDGLLADTEALTKVLTRHVLPGALFYKGICWKIRDTAGSEQIQTQVFKGGVVKVVSESAGARVKEADIIATNGVIHAIDNVI